MTEQPLIVALSSQGERENVWRGIVEPIPHSPVVQCDHLHDRGAQANAPQFRQFRINKGLDPDRCGKPARIRMGPHRFCAIHAGALLLDIALSHAFSREDLA